MVARAARRAGQRARVPFRAVNRRGTPEFDPAFQRHHLLPRQLLGRRCFGAMFDEIGRETVGFDDFRANGLLLPTTEAAALRSAMPLHRGPHRRYNEVVIERVGRIEAAWSTSRHQEAERAFTDALMRLSLLQSALRRRLLSDQRRFVLNGKDPVGTGFDFTELDVMAEAIWNAT